jgi:hypothetical protein
MILGQSAATVGVMAIDNESAVQDVPYEKLRERLLKDGQILEGDFIPLGSAKFSVKADTLEGIVVDDLQAKTNGHWTPSHSTGPWVGRSYIHDGNNNQGKMSVEYRVELPESGEYEVRVSYSPHSNRATNALVIVESADGRKEVRINQTKKPPIDDLFVSVGTYKFSKDNPAKVTISNAGADNYVIADAVQWVKQE